MIENFISEKNESTKWYKVGSDIPLSNEGRPTSIKLDIHDKISNYNKLSKNNFLAVIKASIGGTFGEIENLPVAPYGPRINSIDYDPETGIVTITGVSVGLYRIQDGIVYYNGTTPIDVYAIFGECIVV